jgi:prepilin-type N-terminal cleavage/methylation domain-containing protein
MTTRSLDTLPGNRRSQRGMSLIEVMVVVAIVSTVLIVVYSMIDEATKISLFVESHNDLPVFGQAAVNVIQKDLIQARAIFDSDPTNVGPGYYSALVIPAAYPVMPNTQLPILNPTGDLVPDASVTARYVGNALMITKQLESTPVKLASGTTIMMDRYVFEIFYLTRRTTRNFSNAGYSLELVQAKSNVYADYFQLSNLQSPNGTLTAAQMNEIYAALLAWKDPITGATVPINRAWDPGQSIGSAMYTITAAGYSGPIAQPTIPLPTYSSMITGLAGGRISGKMDYTVAFKPSASTNFPVPDLVPKYAVFNSALPQFPGGFEVLIVGPTGARKVLTRLVLLASYGAGKMDSKESLVISSVPRV